MIGTLLHAQPLHPAAAAGPASCCTQPGSHVLQRSSCQTVQTCAPGPSPTLHGHPTQVHCPAQCADSGALPRAAAAAMHASAPHSCQPPAGIDRCMAARARSDSSALAFCACDCRHNTHLHRWSRCHRLPHTALRPRQCELPAAATAGTRNMRMLEVLYCTEHINAAQYAA